MRQGDLVRWLSEYEQKRTNPFEKNDLWTSTKYDIIGLDWRELREIEVVGLYDSEGNIMNWGQACSAMKKTWKLYRDQKREGLNRTDLAYRILRIQRALGIKETEFNELDGEWVDHELDQEYWDIETGAEDPEDDEEGEDW